MEYYSTNNRQNIVGLREAILRSIAPDGGVYMPNAIPVIPQALFNNIPDMSLTDIAYVVATTMFGSDISPADLNDIVKETLTFEIPLRPVGRDRYALELFHGPTNSFKDVGARFMARIVDYIIKQDGPCSGSINVFVATSGDTGCAVGHGFAGLRNVNVFILHPKGRLLRVPHESFSSPASNIFPIGIRGTFDDCQRLVKEIYTDAELNRSMNITSANSINIARLLPQMFYYFHAYARLLALNPEIGQIAIATPCGNLGNLTAALFSRQMGLPVNRIIAAGHDNERLWGTISSGRLEVSNFNSKALSTNVARINSLFHSSPTLSDLIECHTFNDEEIADQIKTIYAESGYLMDRNTAMACRATNLSLRPGETGVFLATASPEKYAKQLFELLGDDIGLKRSEPESRQQHKINEPTLPPLFPALRRYLLENKI